MKTPPLGISLAVLKSIQCKEVRCPSAEAELLFVSSKPCRGLKVRLLGSYQSPCCLRKDHIFATECTIAKNVSGNDKLVMVPKTLTFASLLLLEATEE